MIRRAKKKPVEIEFFKYESEADISCLKQWIGEELIEKDNGIYIHTLEGDMCISKGDYVIKGVNGEFYPCKPDIFEKTYSVDEVLTLIEKADGKTEYDIIEEIKDYLEEKIACSQKDFKKAWDNTKTETMSYYKGRTDAYEDIFFLLPSDNLKDVKEKGRN